MTRNPRLAVTVGDEALTALERIAAVWGVSPARALSRLVDEAAGSLGERADAEVRLQALRGAALSG